jgi:hypothetical protein
MSTAAAIQIHYSLQPSPIRGHHRYQIVNFNTNIVTNVEVPNRADIFPYFCLRA